MTKCIIDNSERNTDYPLVFYKESDITIHKSYCDNIVIKRVMEERIFNLINFRKIYQYLIKFIKTLKYLNPPLYS